MVIVTSNTMPRSLPEKLLEDGNLAENHIVHERRDGAKQQVEEGAALFRTCEGADR